MIEYCSPVWNPHEQKYINMIAMAQCRAARYTLSKYNNESSVAGMLQKLEWEKTCCNRTSADLISFFKVQHGLIAVPSPSLLKLTIKLVTNSAVMQMEWWSLNEIEQKLGCTLTKFVFEPHWQH